MNIFTKKLGLDKAGDKVFSDPLLVTYVQYMKAFNKEYPHTETTLIQALSKSYGEKLPTMLEAAKKVPSTEKLATNLQAAQFKQWIAEGKTPDAVFKRCLSWNRPAARTLTFGARTTRRTTRNTPENYFLSIPKMYTDRVRTGVKS